jgi:predicted 2-oxoglutarate/Fe(II)-dependent dioxygenase YbiX
MKHSGFFNGLRGTFYGVSIDPQDKSERLITQKSPGYRFLWDFDGRASKLFGSVAIDDSVGKGPISVRRFWIVLDPTLRVMKMIPFTAGGGDVAELLAYVDSLPPPNCFAGFEVHAPILVLPNVFEPALCQTLIDVFEAHGGVETGTMRDVDGKTTEIHDHRHKRRKDVMLKDRALTDLVHKRIRRRLLPEIAKVHQFEVTHIERNLIACYDSRDGGHFGPHRDNTTKGTAHRRFAVSINLNDGFDGGDLSFPEYGSRSIRLPTGCAAIFSCSLLHTVSKVTRGRRYAFLPFLYDNAAAEIRKQNRAFVDERAGKYASPTASDVQEEESTPNSHPGAEAEMGT